MRILVKIGGTQLEDDGARHDLALSIAAAQAAGHSVVLVHGGGNQIRTWTRRLGLTDDYTDGLRHTDADTAEVVTAVLGGLVNKQLVQTLEAVGVRAVGMCGVDGSSFTANKLTPGGRDLGYVGRIENVQPTLIESLVEAGVVPVVATIAALAPGAQGERGRLYNINADMAAAPLAQALHAEAVLFLTDVSAVLDKDRNRIATLTPADCTLLRDNGTLTGGMLPKLSAACEAVRLAPTALVTIAPAAGPDSVLRALKPGIGTRIQPEGQRHG